MFFLYFCRYVNRMLQVVRMLWAQQASADRHGSWSVAGLHRSAGRDRSAGGVHAAPVGSSRGEQAAVDCTHERPRWERGTLRGMVPAPLSMPHACTAAADGGWLVAGIILLAPNNALFCLCVYVTVFSIELVTKKIDYSFRKLCLGEWVSRVNAPPDTIYVIRRRKYCPGIAAFGEGRVEEMGPQTLPSIS